jgi:hypothetical protein
LLRFQIGYWVTEVANNFAGILGVVKDSEEIVDTAFDILSLEALLLVPRYEPTRINDPVKQIFSF